jgi:RNase P/RNase MRP subunit POP5
MKLKLKPSARIKKHYILFSSSNKDKIEKIILDYIGILGYAKASPKFIKPNILSVERKSVTNIKAAFEIADTNIKILRVSGTLKGLNKKN